MEAKTKQTIFSGIQPTGIFTLGNYLGAIKNWAQMQDDYNCIYSVVNMHAITVRQDPAVLRRQTLNSVALLLACGINPEKSILFIQSHVPTHAELSWVLSCSTMFGEMSRMTQFKDKSAKHADNVNVGLFTYPDLMAADILLYKAHLVPVGIDQKQHVELARNIAKRFNNNFGETFVIPDAYIPKNGAKIMSLAEPTKKMSKSDDNQTAFISILDDADTIIKKFKRAITDSDACVCYREGKDGINNLMTIYNAVTGMSFKEIENTFAGKGYGDFKIAVGEAVADHLKPVREKFKEYSENKDFLKSVYQEGAAKACYLSSKTLEKVYKRVGFVPSK